MINPDEASGKVSQILVTDEELRILVNFNLLLISFFSGGRFKVATLDCILGELIKRAIILRGFHRKPQVIFQPNYLDYLLLQVGIGIITYRVILLFIAQNLNCNHVVHQGLT